MKGGDKMKERMLELEVRKALKCHQIFKIFFANKVLLFRK